MKYKLFLVHIVMTSYGKKPWCTFFRHNRRDDPPRDLTAASAKRIKQLEKSGALEYSQILIRKDGIAVLFHPEGSD